LSWAILIYAIHVACGVRIAHNHREMPNPEKYHGDARNAVLNTGFDWAEVLIIAHVWLAFYVWEVVWFELIKGHEHRV
jgi:hypothetical protein